MLRFCQGVSYNFCIDCNDYSGENALVENYNGSEKAFIGDWSRSKNAVEAESSRSEKASWHKKTERPEKGRPEKATSKGS